MLFIHAQSAKCDQRLIRFYRKLVLIKTEDQSNAADRIDSSNFHFQCMQASPSGTCRIRIGPDPDDSKGAGLPCPGSAAAATRFWNGRSAATPIPIRSPPTGRSTRTDPGRVSEWQGGEGSRSFPALPFCCFVVRPPGRDAMS